MCSYLSLFKTNYMASNVSNTIDLAAGSVVYAVHLIVHFPCLDQSAPVFSVQEVTPDSERQSRHPL